MAQEREQEQPDMDSTLTITVSQTSHRDTRDEFFKAIIRYVFKLYLKTLHFVEAKKWKIIGYTKKTLFVCSNVVLYNKYLNKIIVTCGWSFVDVNARCRSIEGRMKPSKDILNKLDIGDTVHKSLQLGR